MNGGIVLFTKKKKKSMNGGWHKPDRCCSRSPIFRSHPSSPTSSLSTHFLHSGEDTKQLVVRFLRPWDPSPCLLLLMSSWHQNSSSSMICLMAYWLKSFADFLTNTLVEISVCASGGWLSSLILILLPAFYACKLIGTNPLRCCVLSCSRTLPPNLPPPDSPFVISSSMLCFGKQALQLFTSSRGLKAQKKS